MVYPESAAPPQEDNDRTSVTSRNEMDEILEQMNRAKRERGELDGDATQIASGELDRYRQELALKQEAASPLDMDGTVEIQNPMEVWKEAQAAIQAARAASGEQMSEISEVDEDLATFVVDPADLNLPLNEVDTLLESSDPTFMMKGKPDHEQLDPAVADEIFGDSSPGFDPSGLGSGVHPYAQNTPPSGRAPANGAVPPMPATQKLPATASQSGLTSKALFDDSEVEEATSPRALDSHPTGPPPMPGGPGPQAGGPDPNHPGPWKLKTGFGLTYEFADTKSLRSWMSSREDLDGYELSQGDDRFFALSEYPQLNRAAPRSMVPSGNFSVPASQGSGLNQQPSQFRNPSSQGSGLNQAYGSGLNEAPGPTRTPAPGVDGTQRGPKVNAEYRPPSRESKASLVLWPIFFLLLLVAVVVALHTFKIVNVFELMGSSEEVQKTTTQESAPSANDEPQPGVDTAAFEKQQRIEAERLLKDAQRLIEGNKLPAARDKLLATQNLTPEDPIVYDLLADVHARLGNADESTKAEEKAKELRSKQAPAAESKDAGTAD